MNQLEKTLYSIELYISDFLHTNNMGHHFSKIYNNNNQNNIYIEISIELYQSIYDHPKFNIFEYFMKEFSNSIRFLLVTRKNKIVLMTRREFINHELNNTYNIYNFKKSFNTLVKFKL